MNTINSGEKIKKILEVDRNTGLIQNCPVTSTTKIRHHLMLDERIQSAKLAVLESSFNEFSATDHTIKKQKKNPPKMIYELLNNSKNSCDQESKADEIRKSSTPQNDINERLKTFDSEKALILFALNLSQNDLDLAKMIELRNFTGQCYVCNGSSKVNDSTTKKNNILRHLSDKHGISVVETTDTFLCLFCGMKATNRELLTIHQFYVHKVN